MESENFQTDEVLARLFSDTSQLLYDQNKKFKVTVKKNYVNDIIMYSKGAQNVARRIILVVSDN
jgi:hypothetical protein